MPCKITFCALSDWRRLDAIENDHIRCDYIMNEKNNIIFSNIKNQRLPKELIDFLSDPDDCATGDCATGDCYYGIHYDQKLIYRFDFSDSGTAIKFKFLYSTI